MITSLEYPSSITILASDKNNKYLAAGFADGTIKILDLSNLSNPKELATINLNNQILALSFSTDSDIPYLASGSSNGKINIWDISDITKPELHTTFYDPNNSILQLWFHPTDPNMLISISSSTIMQMSNTINIWDLTTGKVVTTFTPTTGYGSGGYQGASLNPQKAYIAIRLWGGIVIWDYSKNKVIKTIPCPSQGDYIRVLAFGGPKGEFLASYNRPKVSRAPLSNSECGKYVYLNYLRSKGIVPKHKAPPYNIII